MTLRVLREGPGGWWNAGERLLAEGERLELQIDEHYRIAPPGTDYLFWAVPTILALTADEENQGDEFKIFRQEPAGCLAALLGQSTQDVVSEAGLLMKNEQRKFIANPAVGNDIIVQGS